MSERVDDLADIVLIAFSNHDDLDDYRTRRNLTLPILVDAERSVYRTYGLGRGGLGQIWGWKTLRRYAQILRSRGLHSMSELRPTGEDTRQLGGDFVIAPDGTLAWAHRSEGPADRPDVEEIATAVERARR